MAFLFGLRTLLECLGKADKGRDERDHSGQELHELGEIGHGHHLPSNGGLCPARGLPTARTILAERLTIPDQLMLIVAATLPLVLPSMASGQRVKEFQHAVTSGRIVGRPRTECAAGSIPDAPTNWYTSVIVHVQRPKTYG